MGPVARRVYAGVSGGSVRRRVRHAVVRLWAGGVAQERPRAAAAQEHAVRVPYGSCGAASSATSAGQPTVCVCAPHSPAHFAGCAAREAGAESRVRERREPARAARAAVSAGCPSPSVCVRSPGWRRARALEPKKCVVAAQPQVCGRGVTSGRKISNWDSRAKPDEAGRGAGGMRLDRGPSPSCGRVGLCGPHVAPKHSSLLVSELCPESCGVQCEY